MKLELTKAGRAKAVRTLRRSTAAPLAFRAVRDSPNANELLCLSRADAMHLLALCAASSARMDRAEEAIFAKLGKYVRQA